jgi:hypothetical protein
VRKDDTVLKLQFLGRAPIDQRRAATLHWLPHVFRRLGADAASRSSLHHSLVSSGFDEQEARDLLHDPKEAARRLLGQGSDAPDLVAELERMGAPDALVDDVRRFGDVIADIREPLGFDRCERDDDGGSFMVSYHVAAHRAQVARGDLFFAGVCLSGDAGEGTITIAPRMVRQLCSNGLIAVTGMTGEKNLYVREPSGLTRGTIEGAVETGLSREAVRAVASQMQHLQARPVAEPVTALARHAVDVPHHARSRVLRVFRENRVRTLYGALNAMTQVARDARSVSERVDLETRAGFVLGQGARLLVPTPSVAEEAPCPVTLDR